MNERHLQDVLTRLQTASTENSNNNSHLAYSRIQESLDDVSDLVEEVRGLRTFIDQHTYATPTCVACGRPENMPHVHGCAVVAMLGDD